MPSTEVRIRMPNGTEITVQRSAARVYQARGGVVVTDAEQAVEATPPAVARDDTAPDLPPKSAPKPAWVAAAEDAGIPNPDQLTKDELVTALTPDTQES